MSLVEIVHDEYFLARNSFLVMFGPSTRDTYAFGLRQWEQWCNQVGLHPLQVARPHIDLYGRWLAEVRHNGPSTVQNRLVILRSFYRFCEEERIIEHSPADRVKLPKVSNESKTQGMTLDEVRAFVHASTYNPRYHALVCLLLFNGLRASEACSAKIQNLGVQHDYTTLKVRRKGDKIHTLPLTPATARAVKAVIRGRQTGPILLTEIGTTFSRHLCIEVIRRIGARAQLPYRTHPHMMRHAFATIALDAGMSLQDVQASMNHTDPRTTMRYNRHRNMLERNATHVVTNLVMEAVSGS